MAGTFDARTRELEDKVGFGVLAAKVTFDQPYAHRQHEDLLIPPLVRSVDGEIVPTGQETYRHPRGGGPKYLEKALFYNFTEYYEIIAKGVLVWATGAMVIAGEQFLKKSRDNAPVRNENLRKSASLSIVDHGTTTYTIPGGPRLTRQEISVLNEAAQMPQHWYGAWPPPGGMLGERLEMEEAARTGDWSKFESRQKKEAGAYRQNPRGFVGTSPVAQRPETRSRRTGALRPGSG